MVKKLENVLNELAPERRAKVNQRAAQLATLAPQMPAEVDWRDRWRQQDAWTVREFAQLLRGEIP